MRHATQATLLVLAALVIAFAATLVTLPQSSSAKVKKPASLFAVGGLAGTAYEQTCVRWQPKPGTDYKECAEYGPRPSGNLVDEEALRDRVFALYGGAAAVIVLVGLAFGAGRRGSAPA